MQFSEYDDILMEAKELTVTELTKPIPQEQSIARMNRETTITKEQLEELK